jgi:NADPH:quinone reductase-like Zn-dependent oxidoreductase
LKAFTRSEYGAPDVLRLKEVPTPTPQRSEILVKVRAASVNMADVDYLMGRPTMARLITGLRRPRNPGLGLDLAGVVMAVGDHVFGFEPGDEVFGDLTEFGFGAFAEFACAPQAAFAVKPQGITFEEAAAVPQAAVMAAQGLLRPRPVRPGEQVLVNGAGGNIGPFAVQIAKHLGAEVTGVDAPEKMDFVRSLGADHVIDYTLNDFTANVGKYDRVLDVASHHTISEARRVLRRGGVYLIVPGSIAGTLRAMVAGPLMSILGSRPVRMVPWKPFRGEDVAFLTDLLEKRQVTAVIDRIYNFQDIPEALQYQAEGKATGKIVISLTTLPD